MAKLFIPKDYKSPLALPPTEHAIKKVKDFFQEGLSSELRLRRVSAPLFVMKGTGINDDLNGTERPVAFPINLYLKHILLTLITNNWHIM